MPSETVDPSGSDRRTRKREARRQDLLDLALDLSEELGVEGVTMTALAEAADYAVASLYTYFPSHSALVASMQTRALNLLGGVAESTVQAWDLQLAARSELVDPAEAALARLLIFGDLFLIAPETHAREFRLQQQLLASPNAETPQDAATVLPAAMSVLDRPRRLLADAVTAGALEAPAAATDPIGHPLDGDVLRTFAWVTALNGALLVDGLGAGAPTSGAVLGAEITHALLRGWGADPIHLDQARALSQGWVADHA